MQTAPWRAIIDHLLVNSDLMTKAVLVLLVFMSVFCWSVFLYRFIAIWWRSRQLARTVKRVKAASSISDLQGTAAQEIGTSAGFFISKSIVSIQKNTESILSSQQKIVGSHWSAVQDSMDYALDMMIREQESGLWILSVSAAVSPLIGLFGTVWGLVGAFWGIGQAKSADIAHVAPGIAQALVTTLGGLMIAVPALFMYSILRWQIRNYEQECERLSDAVRMVIQRYIAW